MDIAIEVLLTIQQDVETLAETGLPVLIQELHYEEDQI